jgi:hypothetical protein
MAPSCTSSGALAWIDFTPTTLTPWAVSLSPCRLGSWISHSLNHHSIAARAAQAHLPAPDAARTAPEEVVAVPPHLALLRE